jgi:TolA-binding protein
MTVSELHPDELLWREACGTLSPDERADLNAHLQRCPACAMERIVRMEAARARVPSEADHAIAARLVERVLAASERRPAAPIRVGWRRPLAVAAAVLLFVAGTAAAAAALVVRVRAQRATRAAVLRSQAVSPETVARQRAPEGTPDLPLADTGRTGDIDAPPGDAQIPRAVSPPRYRRSLHDNHRSKWGPARSRALAYAASGRPVGTQHSAPPTEAPLPRATQPSSIQSPARPIQAPAQAVERAPPPPSQQPSTESAPAVVDPPPFRAPQILRRAEQARTARRWADASRAFEDLGRRYPGTREEIVGRALYGQLLLDQLGAPGRALTMFERYLAADPSGALAEEARLGRAQALRQLGRLHEERSAWRELLRQHPGSVHAAAARTRLATLDAP